MPFFPSPVETHASLMNRMKARAFRPASHAIAFIAPWEAQERVKPARTQLQTLCSDAKTHLSEEEPKEKDFLETLEEFRKDHFEPLLKTIDEGNFNCESPQIFFDIDLSYEIIEKLAEEYDTFGKPRTQVISEKIHEYKPLPSFKESLKKIDWKKWAIGGTAAFGAWWLLTRRTSEAILPVKEQEKKEAAAELEKKKMKVGPIVKAETWEVTEEDKTLLRRLIEKMTGG